jgi:hypothetical protein
MAINNTKKRNWNRFIKKFLFAFLVILILAVGAFSIWAFQDYDAIQTSYLDVLKNKNVTIKSTDKFIEISPAVDTTLTAFIFYPGAKVEPESYVAILSSIALENNLKIIVSRMPLKLAFFGINNAKEVKDAFPQIKHWYIGGHSLGGSMACMYVSK